MFSCELYEISKNTFFTEHLGATASKHLSMQHIKWITSQRSRFSTVNFSFFSEIFAAGKSTGKFAGFIE